MDLSVSDLSYLFRSDFNTVEDWRKFILLCENLTEFKNLANDRVFSQVKSDMSIQNKWEFRYISSTSEFICNLKGYNNLEHFKIKISDCGYSYSISAGSNVHLKNKLFPKLILDLRYRPLILTDSFGRIDSISTYSITEEGNYRFGTLDDCRIKKEDMKWFAFHETEILVSQISEKLERFFNNDKLMQLILELNQEIDNDVLSL